MSEDNFRNGRLVIVALVVALAMTLPLIWLVKRNLRPTAGVSSEPRIWEESSIALSADIQRGIARGEKPVLSEDGRRVLFAAISEGGRRTLFLWEQGLGYSNIASEQAVSSYALAGDGLAVAFLAGKPNKNIFLWQEGAGVKKISASIFEGDWQVSLNSEMGLRAAKIFLFPASGAKLDGQVVTEPRALSAEGIFQTFSELGAAGIVMRPGDKSSLLEIDQDRAFVKKVNFGKKAVPFDVDCDKKTDLVQLRNSDGEMLWRALTLGGLDGAADSITVSLNKTLSWRFGPAHSVPVLGDYNGDGVNDIAVFVPGFLPNSPGEGNWRVLFSDKNCASGALGGLVSRNSWEIFWGSPDSLAVPGDYDGDGVTDPAVYERKLGVWSVLLSGGGFNAAKAELGLAGFGLKVQWGLSDDLPVPADYDGDGRTDFAVVRKIEVRNIGAEKAESKLHWLIKYNYKHDSPKNPLETDFGVVGDVPVPADYDGDGEADIAVYRQEGAKENPGAWLLRLGKRRSAKVNWPIADAEAFAADFDNDGRADPAAFSPHSPERVLIRNSHFGDELIETTSLRAPFVTHIKWGLVDEVPAILLLRRHQQGIKE